MIDITGVTPQIIMSPYTPLKSVTPCYDWGSMIYLRNHNSVTPVTLHVTGRNVTGGGIYNIPPVTVSVTPYHKTNTDNKNLYKLFSIQGGN